MLSFKFCHSFSVSLKIAIKQRVLQFFFFKFQVYNDIDGYGVEWTLGLAYNYVMSAITAQPGPAHIYDKYIKSILSKRKK